MSNSLLEIDFFIISIESLEREIEFSIFFFSPRNLSSSRFNFILSAHESIIFFFIFPKFNLHQFFLFIAFCFSSFCEERISLNSERSLSILLDSAAKFLDFFPCFFNFFNGFFLFKFKLSNLFFYIGNIINNNFPLSDSIFQINIIKFYLQAVQFILAFLNFLLFGEFIL